MYKVLFLILIVIFIACKKIPEYPVTPQISFKECYINPDTTDALGNKIYYIEIRFTVIDGDGDIGSLPEDSLNQSNSKIYLMLYVKDSGQYGLYTFLPDSLDTINYRIPYIEQAAGTCKTLKAEIRVKNILEKIMFNYDTIKYKFFITDRSLHKSNIEETPEIVLTQ